MNIGDTYTDKYGQVGTITKINDRVVVINCPARVSGKIVIERWHFDWSHSHGGITITPAEPIRRTS